MTAQPNGSAAEHGEASSSSSTLPMSLPEYKRYGRQMILDRFGLPGQLKLRNAKVLVVGAGGLGCPSIQYLAAAGVGFISIVDHDTVEVSNLARQILHTDDRVGMNKALSAAIAAQLLNPYIQLQPIAEALSVHNAVQLIGQHDVVLDCTDNVLTRYLISDAAVRCGRPVVSGAAQGVEGQLVTLHKAIKRGDASQRGPCYRCLFPKAPRPQDVTDCEDGGVLGTITGLVGTMQAVETIKLLADLEGDGDDDDDDDIDRAPYMTLVSPMSFPPFRSVRLRPRRLASCRACGDAQHMTADDASKMIADDLRNEDYIAFCGLDNARQLQGFPEVSAAELHRALRASTTSPPPILLDVRPPVEFGIAKLANTINTPFRQIDSDPAGRYRDLLRAASKGQADDRSTTQNVYVLCRRGNDSRLACHALSAAAAAAATAADQFSVSLSFINVKGGLRAWSSEVDDQFPVY